MEYNELPLALFALLGESDISETHYKFIVSNYLPVSNLWARKKSHRMIINRYLNVCVKYLQSHDTNTLNNIVESLCSMYEDEHMLRVRNLEEKIQTLTHDNHFLRQQRDAALNMAERAMLSACDVLSANSNVSGWQVKNEMQDKKIQQLNDLHAIMNDIDSLRHSFIQDSWKNHQQQQSEGNQITDSHEMPDTFRSSGGSIDLHTRNEPVSQRAGLDSVEKEIEQRLLQEPIAKGLRNSLINLYMIVGLSTA